MDMNSVIYIILEIESDYFVIYFDNALQKKEENF